MGGTSIRRRRTPDEPIPDTADALARPRTRGKSEHTSMAKAAHEPRRDLGRTQAGRGRLPASGRPSIRRPGMGGYRSG